MYALSQYHNGIYNADIPNDYAKGFCNAIQLWGSHAYDRSFSLPEDGADFRQGFRGVVDARQKGVFRKKSDEFLRGYEDALRLFQAAKGL